MTTVRPRRVDDALSAPAAGGGGLSQAPVLPAPRRRRRPGLLALAVVMVVLGALGAASVATSLGETSSVIAVAREVPRGQAITAADLVEARVPADPALTPIPYGDRDRIVGLLAATTLLPGTLLTAEAVTGERVPPPGQHLVGVGVSAVQSPATAVEPGDRVLLVPVADPAAAVAAGSANAAVADPVAATVVRAGAPGTDGLRIVDVLVDADDGPDVAARAAAGLVAIVVVAAE